VIPTPPGKTRITIRLDDDILDWFREQVHAAGGGNYQTLINVALREYLAHRREPLQQGGECGEAPEAEIEDVRDQRVAYLLPLTSLPRHPFHGSLERKPSGIPVAMVLRLWCGGQYRFSFFRCRAGTPPLRLTSLQGACHPLVNERASRG